MYIEMKSGIVFKTNAKDEIELWELLNDKGFFITIGGIGNFNKLEIRNSFRMWQNPILEWLAKHTYAEQLSLRAVINARKKDWKPVKSYTQLLEIYEDMKRKSLLNTLLLPFYVASDEDTLAIESQ